MLIVFYLLRYAQMLKNKNCAYITTYSRQFRETVLLGCIRVNLQQSTLQVPLDNDCLIRVYQSFAAIFQKYFLLCWHYS